MLYTYLVKVVYISFGVGLFIIELWVFGDTSERWYSSSHASFFCNSQYGNIGYNTDKQNRKSTYQLISVQYHTVFLTLIQNLFINGYLLGT